MTTRQHSREALRAHAANLAAVASLPDEIRRLDLALASPRVSNPEKLPGGGAENDRLERLVVRRDELKLRLEIAELSVRAVERALDTLAPDERHVLEVMDVYRQRGAPARLAEDLHYSDTSTVYKLEARALDRFALAMYGGDYTWAVT